MRSNHRMNCVCVYIGEYALIFYVCVCCRQDRNKIPLGYIKKIRKVYDVDVRTHCMIYHILFASIVLFAFKME